MEGMRGMRGDTRVGLLPVSAWTCNGGHPLVAAVAAAVAAGVMAGVTRKLHHCPPTTRPQEEQASSKPTPADTQATHDDAMI